MKILGIPGSPRKGQNCEKMTTAVLEVAKNRGFDVDFVFLSTSQVDPCKTCDTAEKKTHVLLKTTWKKSMKK